MKYLKILLVGLLVSGALALAVRAAVRPEPRELTLIARGMAFYLPGDPTPNPRLIAGRGEDAADHAAQRGPGDEPTIWRSRAAPGRGNPRPFSAGPGSRRI